MQYRAAVYISRTSNSVCRIWSGAVYVNVPNQNFTAFCYINKKRVGHFISILKSHKITIKVDTNLTAYSSFQVTFDFSHT